MEAMALIVEFSNYFGHNGFVYEMPWMGAMLISNGGWPGGMCIVPVVGPFCRLGNAKRGCGNFYMHDGITLDPGYYVV